ncbi:MAG: alpha/beta hydrolase [archaeon]
MNCIIVHGASLYDKKKISKGFPQQNERSWIPWLKRELEESGIKTDNPLMPKNWLPVYEDWRKEFEKLEVNKNTILIGHSLGATFLVRWLGETKKKVKKLILVAPAKFDDDDNEYYKNFYNFEIDKDIAKNKITIFNSTNDWAAIQRAAKLYHKVLRGKLIELKERGHFIQKKPNEKIEFPELLEEVLG